jgi:hypothetical protein
LFTRHQSCGTGWVFAKRVVKSLTMVDLPVPSVR